MPDVAHLHHMPGHIYLQVGQYKKAADSNIDAVVVDERYSAERGSVKYIMPSYAHNAHFIWSASTIEGRSDSAITAALKTRDAIMGTPPPSRRHEHVGAETCRGSAVRLREVRPMGRSCPYGSNRAPTLSSRRRRYCSKATTFPGSTTWLPTASGS